MTNIEKVKRILDAGHWVKVTYDDGIIRTFTSYYEDRFSCIKDDCLYANPATTINGTIEVIQRIPTPYKAWDKVLVLSHPDLDIKAVQSMVWTICTINSVNNPYYALIVFIMAIIVFGLMINQIGFTSLPIASHQHSRKTRYLEKKWR